MINMEQVEKLVSLVKTYQDTSTGGNADEWVSKCLMTEEEYTDWKAFREIENLACEAGNKAEKAVPFPDYTAIFEQAGLTEYVGLRQKLALVKETLVSIERAVQSLEAFIPYRGHKSLYSQCDLAQMAESLIKRMQAENNYDGLVQEKKRIEEQIKARERANSRVVKLRTEAYSHCEQQRAEARIRTMQKVLSLYPDIVSRGQRAEEAIRQRVIEKRATLVAEMRAILEKAQEVSDARNK